MKRLFSRKGFTLTEMLIGLVVLLILAGTVSAMMMSGFGIYGRTALRNSAQSTADQLYELISSRLTYAVDLTVSDDVRYIESMYNMQEDAAVCIYIPSDGSFVGLGVGALAPPSVIPPSQLKGMRLDAEVNYQSDSLVEITIAVESADDGRILYSRTGSVHLMNAANPELDSFCDVQSCDNSAADIYFVFKELA